MSKKLKVNRKVDKRERSISQNKSIKMNVAFSRLCILISFCEGGICLKGMISFDYYIYSDFSGYWGSTFSSDSAF